MLPIIITNYPQNHLPFENKTDCPDQGLNWLECHPVHQKVAGSIPTQSGHIPMLRVQSLVRVHMGGNQSMFFSLKKKLIYPRVQI